MGEWPFEYWPVSAFTNFVGVFEFSVWGLSNRHTDTKVLFRTAFSLWKAKAITLGDASSCLRFFSPGNFPRPLLDISRLFYFAQVIGFNCHRVAKPQHVC